MNETVNLIFAGVGGQGVLLVAELTALAAARAGFDVKQTEVHGVSQRGGSVESHVRFGAQVHSPLVIPGEADVVVGLEKLEALRYASFLRQASLPSGRTDPDGAKSNGPTGRDGVLLVNDHEIIPGSLAGAAEKYPHHALDFLQSKGLRVLTVPASQRALDLGDGRMANMVMLGCLSRLTPQVSPDIWIETLLSRVPERFREANLRAFQAGGEYAE